MIPLKLAPRDMQSMKSSLWPRNHQNREEWKVAWFLWIKRASLWLVTDGMQAGIRSTPVGSPSWGVWCWNTWSLLRRWKHHWEFIREHLRDVSVPVTDDQIALISLLDHWCSHFYEDWKFKWHQSYSTEMIWSLLTEQHTDSSGTSASLRVLSAEAEPEVKRKMSLASFCQQQGSSATSESTAAFSGE